MVTIPTLDEIAGSTVMVKLRELIKKFIGFATEVDTALDDRYTKSETYSKGEVTSMLTTLNNRIGNVEGNVLDLDYDKQDKLTAGDNITISNNVISASGVSLIQGISEFLTQFYIIEGIDDSKNYQITIVWNSTSYHECIFTFVLTAADMAGTVNWTYYNGTISVYIEYNAGSLKVQPSTHTSGDLKYTLMEFDA